MGLNLDGFYRRIEAVIDKDLAGEKLAESDDADFYLLRVEDRIGGLVQPRAELDVAGPGAQVCAFVSCVNESIPEVSCAEGTIARFEEMQGCCAEAADGERATVSVNPSCATADDSVDVLFRVQATEDGATCDDMYSLRFGDE